MTNRPPPSYAPHFDEARPAFELRYAWAWAKELLEMAVIVYGDPRAVLEREFVRRAWRRDFYAWLRPLEALVRRLILIEACGWAPPPHAPATAKPRRTHIAKPSPAARPHTRAFALFPSLPAPSPTARATQRVHVRRRDPLDDGFAPSLGAAQRLNALVLTIEDPWRAVQRMARRLAKRDPRPARLLDIRPPGLRPPHDQFFDDAQAEAERALARRDYFNDS